MNKRLSIVAFSLIAFVFFAVLIGFNNPSLAQNQNEILSEEDNLSELTVKIASLTTKFRNKKFYENNQLEDSITELAERRYSKLTELIENDTMEVLRVALPEDVLSKIPFELQNYFEKREETEGELEVVSECEDNDERILYYLKNGKERLSLRFAKQPDEELRTGERVSIKGVRIGETIAVDESSLPKNSDSFQASAMTLPNTFGEQKVLVLLVNFQNDQRQPFTIDQARNLVFGTVNNFYREASYQQTWLTGDAYGYFTLPINSGDCGGSQTATYARQAAINAGINVSAYNKFMYVYPQMSGCNYSGRGTIGGNEVWLNGSLSQWTVAHELGHNYGLYHARALECGSAVLGNNCSTIEYGNTVDTMGTENAHFHSYQKERLGWLNFNVSPPITTVQTGGNYFIAPYSAQDGKTKALKILKSVDSSGNKTWYHLEVRRPIGFDRFVLSNSNFMNGVIITMNKETNGQENYLLDLTPETSSWSDAALIVNRSYHDSSAGLTITPLSVDDSGATVNINFGGTTCNQANPTVSVNPSTTQWVGAGGSASYMVTVRNNDSSACPNANFNLQANVPSGWNGSFVSPILNIASGASATTTLQVSNPSWTADGFYSLGINAGNSSAPSFTASASINYAVYSSLAVNVSLNQTSYSRNQTALITAMVSANNARMAGAAVTFTITKSDGSKITGNAVSATDGSATFTYRFNRKVDPLGTYTVNVNANLNGISGSGSTNFTVK